VREQSPGAQPERSAQETSASRQRPSVLSGRHWSGGDSFAQDKKAPGALARSTQRLRRGSAAIVRSCGWVGGLFPALFVRRDAWGVHQAPPLSGGPNAVAEVIGCAAGQSLADSGGLPHEREGQISRRISRVKLPPAWSVRIPIFTRETFPEEALPLPLATSVARAAAVFRPPLPKPPGIRRGGSSCRSFLGSQKCLQTEQAMPPRPPAKQREHVPGLAWYGHRQGDDHCVGLRIVEGKPEPALGPLQLLDALAVGSERRSASAMVGSGPDRACRAGCLEH
jgi:hypothetical protein